MARTDVASIIVAAPVERVYTALVDPEALLSWLPPKGMTATFEHFDARPGGSYRMVLTYADAAGSPGKSSGRSDIVDVRFVDLVAGSRVVQAVDFVSSNPAFAGTMTITWKVGAAEGGTLVQVEANDVPAGISPAEHVAGLNSSLSNLVAHLR